VRAEGAVRSATPCPPFAPEPLPAGPWGVRVVAASVVAGPQLQHILAAHVHAVGQALAAKACQAVGHLRAGRVRQGVAQPVLLWCWPRAGRRAAAHLSPQGGVHPAQELLQLLLDQPQRGAPSWLGR
jgi:hypothetical protein